MSSGTRRGILIVGGLVAAAAVAAGFALSLRPLAAGDVQVITHGEEVDLAAHAVAGKYTVFDFYAPWCPPCRILGPALERLAARHPESLAVRKVDIVDWTMPVATQHGIEALPYLVLYDQQGRRMAEGEGVFEALTRIYGSTAREVAEATHEQQEQAPAGGPDPHQPTPAGRTSL